MKQRDYQVGFRAAIVFAMVSFISVIFLASANLTFAATANKKSTAHVRTSAVDRTEDRIKKLQDSLNITKEQEPLWNNLTQVMRENAKDMDALTKDRETVKAMNSVDRLKFYTQVAETHLAQLKKLIPPFEEFYGSLSDNQKKVMDTIFATGKYGKHKKK